MFRAFGDNCQDWLLICQTHLISNALNLLVYGVVDGSDRPSSGDQRASLLGIKRYLITQVRLKGMLDRSTINRMAFWSEASHHAWNARCGSEPLYRVCILYMIGVWVNASRRL